jgi:serine/threonine-protein kinase
MNLLRESSLVAGRYKILEPFDSGQHLECHLATDTESGNVVRVYVFAPNEVPGEKSIVHLEGELAKRRKIDHPGVYRMLDYGRIDLEGGAQTVFYVSEHTEGADRLSDRIAGQPEKPLRFREVLSLVKSLAESLAAIHSQRLCSSSLDPKSIFVKGQEEIKLPAFMFVSSAQWLRDKSAVCRRSGTNYRYIAPEMICDSGAMVGDEKSDVYLLGVLAYELATGAVPFEGTTETMIQMHRSEPPPSLVKQSGLPDWYDQLVKSCLEKVAVYRPFIGAVIDEVSKHLAEDEGLDRVLEYPDRRMKNILFVEDNKLDQLFLSRLVSSERLPFSFHFAPSIERAGKLIKANRFSVIVTDYILPDGTALDLLSKCGEIPTVVVTGSRLEEVKAAVMAAGAYECIGKEPGQAHLGRIPGCIAKVLELKALRQELGALKTRVDGALGAVRDALASLTEPNSPLRDTLQRIEAVLLKEDEYIQL